MTSRFVVRPTDSDRALTFTAQFVHDPDARQLTKRTVEYWRGGLLIACGVLMFGGFRAWDADWIPGLIACVIVGAGLICGFMTLDIGAGRRIASHVAAFLRWIDLEAIPAAERDQLHRLLWDHHKILCLLNDAPSATIGSDELGRRLGAIEREIETLCRPYHKHLPQSMPAPAAQQPISSPEEN